MGVVGMLVGVFIAAQLAWPELNFGIPWLSYGRLRPLHTNAVIFAFGGCACSPPATTWCSAPARRCSGRWPFTFWGWQLVIWPPPSPAAGLHPGKEYAELEWPIDILIAVVWVSYAIVFFGTIGIRKVAHLCGQLVLRRLHHGRGPAAHRQQRGHARRLDEELLRLRRRAGRHGAVVVRPQRRGLLPDRRLPGHDVLLHPQAGRPSGVLYRLSIVHFWALIFTYMWAGPHHLHYTALPDWTQSVGMVFSLILLAPSWGGMINGIMTLSGAWHKLRDDPILRFLIVSLSFYGMSTFEGPMMSIKTVNALSHYTDWTVGHVHSGALGWVGLVTMGSLYYLIPRLFGREDALRQGHRAALLDGHHRHRAVHRRDVDCRRDAGPDVARGQPDGTLTYTFVESVKATYPFYVIRGRRSAVPGGMLVMAWNTWKTAIAGRSVKVAMPAVVAHA
jgi:cytochrome c oxidase cbb3-type subunit 1